MSGSCARLYGLAVLAVLAVVSYLPAQDVLEQKKRERDIQAQQTVADVNAALDKSRQLEKTNASEAKSLIEKCLLTVSDSNVLDDKQRADLRSRLLSRLKEVNATASEQRAGNDAASKAAADKAARAEKERLEMAKVLDQQKSTYDQAKQKVESGKQALETQKQIDAVRSKGVTNINNDILKTASKMDEQRITQQFIAASDKRKPKLSPQDAAVLKALNSTLSVDFSKDRDSLKDVFDILSLKAKAGGGQLNIFPDAGSLKDVGVEYETRVGFKAEKVTVRTVLKKVLADVGLTYVIKEGNVHVITPDRAKDYTTVRFYPVQDLVAPFNTKWGAVANKVQMQQQANNLIQMIVSTIEPASWEGIGERGYGTIRYDPATMSLVIRQTAEMHYMLGGGFGGR